MRIKLTKQELERLFINYSTTEWKAEDERLVDACRDLDHADEKDLFEIYNTFCRYLRIDGLCIYRMSEFNSFEFADNVEQKRLTAHIDLDDMYFAMDLFGYSGYRSFNDLNSYLKYNEPLNLNYIKNMLEYTFEDVEDEEEGEDDE